MNNSRTVEKKIIWHLEADGFQDESLRQLLEVGAYEGGFGKAAQAYFRELLMLCPKEGDDETTSDSDDFDLGNFDRDIAAMCKSAGIPVPDEATSATDTCPKCRGPMERGHALCRACIKAIASEGDVPGTNPHPAGVYDGPMATAAARLGKLADACRGGCKPSEPEDFDQSARRSAQSEWDKGRG